MNDWDRYSVIMRLSEAEQELLRRQKDPKGEFRRQSGGRIELVVALLLVAVLSIPIVLMVTGVF